nr:hypothetical protein [Tanacetum cinerariifolium]
MHSMGKIVTKLHAMLKLHEQILPPKEVAHALHAIRVGRIQKNKIKNRIRLLRDIKGKAKKRWAMHLCLHYLLLPNPRILQHPRRIIQRRTRSATNVVKYGIGEGIVPFISPRSQGKQETEAMSFKSVRGRWSSNKRAKLNLDSTLLWHCRLRHINKKRMEKLQHDGLLNLTDIKSLENCVSCMSGKMAKKSYSHQVERAKNLLGLIHTDVCGPFKIMSRQGAYYFITFTEEFGHTSLYHEVDGQEIDEPQSDINPIRRCTRTRRSPDRMYLYIDAEEHELGDLGEPANYIRAIRILIAIAAFYDYEIWQMDVKTTFLNGYLNEEVYMEQLEGFVNQKFPNRICKIKHVKSYLGRCFAMKDLGEATYILGIKIYGDRSKRLIGLCQSAYIEKILKRYYMENSKRGTILMQEKLKFSKLQGASTPAEIQSMQNIPYTSDVGSIIYTVRCTCPDVAFAQNITSRFQQNPGKVHWTAVKNILKYLRNTKDMFLIPEIRYVFVLNGGVVDWKSTKQSIFATSSTDVEYIAAFDALKKVVWIHKFISRLGVVPKYEAINMYCDSTRAVAIAKDHGVIKGVANYQYICKPATLTLKWELSELKCSKTSMVITYLNPAAGGIFLYKTPNQTYQLLEDKVKLKLDWAKNKKTKSSLKKIVAFTDEGSSNSDIDKIMARIDAMTVKMDAQYKELQSRAKQSIPDLDDDDMPMSREEQAKFMQTFDLKGTHIEHGLKRAFMSLYGQDNDNLKSTMLLNVDQLQKQLDKDEFQEEGSTGAFWVINRQFQMFIDSQFTLDYNSQMTDKYFAKYTGIKDRRVNKRQMQTQESKIDTGKAVDADFVDTESCGTKSDVQDDSSRLPNAFKSKRPPMSKPRFAFQVDVNNNLTNQVIQHYLPKRRASALAKPDQMIAYSSSRNSSKNMPRFSLNDMVRNHYLEEAKKTTQEKDRNSKSSVIHSTRLQNTTNGSKPKPRINDQTNKSLPVSKSSCVTSNVVPIVNHSKNSSSFSDSKHFVCSTCHKCVFNANHDTCITILLKEVNSRAKIQSHKTRNSNKPVEQKSRTQKPSWQIFTRHRFSPNKSSVVYEKTSLRSGLRWQPTGKIIKTVDLRRIPT